MRQGVCDSILSRRVKIAQQYLQSVQVRQMFQLLEQFGLFVT